MQLFAFVLSRFPDPYAILLGSSIGIVCRHWWQTLLASFAGGTAMVLVFGLFGGMSPDVPAYIAVDDIVVALWASLAFVLRERLRRYKSVGMQAHPTVPLE